jgi:phosphinothricin acetyltransferase
MVEADWPQVARIYQEGIETGNATFETDVPSWDEWHAGHLEVARLVVETNDGVVAWAALSPVSKRHVYRGVAEHSIYVTQTAQGSGVGTALLGALIGVSEDAGIWTLQTGIFPENTPSIDLHTKLGFRTLGVRERIGAHHGKWRDVVLMERRSSRV